MLMIGVQMLIAAAFVGAFREDQKPTGGVPPPIGLVGTIHPSPDALCTINTPMLVANAKQSNLMITFKIFLL